MLKELMLLTASGGKRTLFWSEAAGRKTLGSRWILKLAWWEMNATCCQVFRTVHTPIIFSNTPWPSMTQLIHAVGVMVCQNLSFTNFPPSHLKHCRQNFCRRLLLPLMWAVANFHQSVTITPAHLCQPTKHYHPFHHYYKDYLPWWTVVNQWFTKQPRSFDLSFFPHYVCGPIKKLSPFHWYLICNILCGPIMIYSGFGFLVGQKPEVLWRC